MKIWGVFISSKIWTLSIYIFGWSSKRSRNLVILSWLFLLHKPFHTIIRITFLMRTILAQLRWWFLWSSRIRKLIRQMGSQNTLVVRIKVKSLTVKMILNSLNMFLHELLVNILPHLRFLQVPRFHLMLKVSLTQSSQVSLRRILSYFAASS